MSRKLELVQNEVNAALSRFDANGDGVLQFEGSLNYCRLGFNIPVFTHSDFQTLLKRIGILRRDVCWSSENTHRLQSPDVCLFWL